MVREDVGVPKMDSGTNKQIKELEDRCHSDLLDTCRTIASENKVTQASIINLQAIKVMSEKMPENQQEMLQIPHVTKANYEKYGARFLTITQNYAAEKLSEILL